MFMIKKYLLKIIIIIISIRRTLKEYNLGEIVLYMKEGQDFEDRWILYQGVEDPYWNLSRLGTHEQIEHIHKDQFRKYWDVDNQLKVFQSNYKFYMSNWFNIWVKETIKNIINILLNMKYIN